MPTLKPGDPLPEFLVTNHLGRAVRSADFKGRATVIFVYPKADTPG